MVATSLPATSEAHDTARVVASVASGATISTVSYNVSVSDLQEPEKGEPEFSGVIFAQPLDFLVR